MEKTCRNGHTYSTSQRRDGRCGQCNTARNRRYRKTDKGRATDFRYESKRRNPVTHPDRWYYRIKWFLKDRIFRKNQKIKELEGTLA